MKSLGLFATLLLVSTGCEQAKSKLDEVPKGAPGAGASATGGSIEDRVARLEADNAKYKDMLEMIHQAYEQQKAGGGRGQRQRPGELDPEGMYAVDITPDLQSGQSEGPNDALVTIVEAWDFG